MIYGVELLQTTRVVEEWEEPTDTGSAKARMIFLQISGASWMFGRIVFSAYLVECPLRTKKGVFLGKKAFSVKKFFCIEAARYLHEVWMSLVAMHSRGFMGPGKRIESRL